jgi:hypothetical protein
LCGRLSLRLRHGECEDFFLKLFPAKSDAQAIESNDPLWRDPVAVQAKALSDLMSRAGKVSEQHCRTMPNNAALCHSCSDKGEKHVAA